MKTELQHGNVMRENYRRYNVADMLCWSAHTRWPNKSCPVGVGRKIPPFDYLTLGQFVIGFLNNVMNTKHPELARNMLIQLNEMVKLAENLSWPIPHGAFATSMHKIEDGALT